MSKEPLIGWPIALYPIYLYIVSLAGGWWAAVTLPLLLCLAYRTFRFVMNENSGSDLFAILSLAYLTGIRQMAPDWIAAGIIALSFWTGRKNRQSYPDST